MKHFPLFLIAFLMLSCTKAKNQIPQVGVPEKIDNPYQIELSANPVEDQVYSLVLNMELAESAHFISPFSQGDYKGKFNISINSNNRVVFNDDLTQTPQSIETIDPWSGGPVSYVSENTVFTKSFRVLLDADFTVSGIIQFVIEPNCTMEDVPFMITQRDGKVTAQLTPERYLKPHEYGGWSCPDNFGFPPVNVKELYQVPVVNGRLPTKEETQNGTSLIYIDPLKHLDARPLDMTFPRLARCYSQYTKKDEMVIVIQGVIVGGDTIAGYRYLNGGNGSAWFHDVNFLTDEEVAGLEATPFVDLVMGVDAEPQELFKMITDSVRNGEMGKKFDEKLSLDGQPIKGEVTAYWDDLYLQVDYNLDGHHYVEKFLMIKNQEDATTELHVVAGPIEGDFGAHQEAWKKWYDEIVATVEAEK